MVLLLWLAAPYWPGTVDDVYISVGFARHWAETGSLTWTDGVRVEGYSNFVMVALLALGMALGADGGLWAQWIALLSGIGILLLASRLLPRSPMGTLALLGLAAWTPMCRWSVVGMETTLFALLLAIGWGGALRGGRAWGLGVAALALASMTRLEGVAGLGLGLLLRVRGGRGRQGGDGLAVAALVGLVAYHVGRVAWFGEWWPTPYLVKVAGQPLTWHGLAQGGADLGTAAGLLGATWLATRPRGAWVAALPLVVQVVVLARAGGDWMASGRLVLPGVVATVVGWAVVAREAPRVWGWGWLVWVGVVIGGGWESRGYGAWHLQRRSAKELIFGLPAFVRGLDTPVAEDVAWAANHLEADASFLAVDAGMLGSLPEARLLDLRGLVTRPFAEAIGQGQAESHLRALLEDERHPAHLRIAAWGGAAFPDLPGWMTGPFEGWTEIHYGDGTIRWYPAVEEPAAEALRARRWGLLLQDFGSQPFLHWQAALAYADIGQLERAAGILANAGERWPRDARFQGGASCLGFTSSDQPLDCHGADGTTLRTDAHLLSRPIYGIDALKLHLSCGSTGTELRMKHSLEGEGCPTEIVESMVACGGQLVVPTSSCGGTLRLRLESAGEGPPGDPIWITLE